MRRAIVEAHDVEPAALVLIEPGTVPKAPNGKIQRRSGRQQFLEGGLAVVAEWRRPEHRDDASRARALDRSSLECGIAERLARELGLAAADVDRSQPFADLGLGSIAGAALVGEIEDWLGIVLEPTTLWEHPTVEALAAALEHELPSGSAPEPADPW
jgi:acyl carrier protein